MIDQVRGKISLISTLLVTQVKQDRNGRHWEEHKKKKMSTARGDKRGSDSHSKIFPGVAKYVTIKGGLLARRFKSFRTPTAR